MFVLTWDRLSNSFAVSWEERLAIKRSSANCVRFDAEKSLDRFHLPTIHVIELRGIPAGLCDARAGAPVTRMRTNHVQEQPR